MRTFRSDRFGTEDASGDLVGVELQTFEEQRQLRKHGELPRTAFVVVFDQDGKLRRFPGFGQFQPDFEETEFLTSLRDIALDAAEDLF